MNSVVVKPYLCWRAPEADVELFTDLFRYGYHEGMHKRAFGKTKDKWEKFAEDLFATQQGFIGKEKITSGMQELRDSRLYMAGKMDAARTYPDWKVIYLSLMQLSRSCLKRSNKKKLKKK